MSSTSLTEEQRRRMEENRRKALELKAAKGKQGQGNVGSCSANKSTTNNPLPLPSSNNGNNRPGSANTGSNSCITNRPGTAPSSTSTQNYQGRDNRNNASAGLPPGGKGISGTCSLISRDRFKVEVPYNPQVISIFKGTTGSQYDPGTKIWTFPLSQYSSLIGALDSLRPSVCVGGLPPFILKWFRNKQRKEDEQVDLSRIDPVLLRALMPFQKEGVLFGIRRGGKVLIADDMGLGKTIQALGITHYYYNDWPLLIVSPASMRYRWRESIWEWLPSVPAGSVIVLESGKFNMADVKVVIVSYDFLQRKQQELQGFQTVIMDESHYLKNFKTARTKAAMPICQNAKHTILLSGTPALSRPLELYSQLCAVCPFLMSFNDYGIRYCDGKKGPFAWDYSGCSNATELSLLLEETIMIRRLKSEVLKQLPPKMRHLVILDPHQIKKDSKALKAKRAAYNNAKEGKKSGAEVRNMLLEYYHETAMIKLPAVTTYIEELVAAEKKFLVFAHHRTMLDGICESLDNSKVMYIRIDGSNTGEERQYFVDQFQSRDDVRVAVLSIMAANAGLTLTAAGLVIFAELYWNPGILTQAEDRAHRIGQEDSVVVEYLLASGTADDTLWPMIQEKLSVLNKAGLSKDDFQDAHAFTGPSLKADSASQEKTIKDFFGPSSKSVVETNDQMNKDNTNINADAEFQMLKEDNDLLMQLVNDSF